MSRRFSQIKKGAEYNQGLDNYIDYLRNAESRPTKRLQGGVRGSRRTTVPAAVRPFGMVLEGDFALTRISTESQTGIGSTIATRTFTSGANLTAAVSYAQSKITKLYYLKYVGDTFTAPIGSLSDTEEEQTGGAAVKTAIIAAFGGSDIKRVSISPEKVPV
jgi:hypothetical protein